MVRKTVQYTLKSYHYTIPHICFKMLSDSMYHHYKHIITVHNCTSYPCMTLPRCFVWPWPRWLSTNIIEGSC